ncbi:GNAT family N-acetyltransferase [Arcanobacterium haemolyticum]|nr:GNAT family N-acetyltransferase [Arcanobacterium haemolyticum]
MVPIQWVPLGPEQSDDVWSLIRAIEETDEPGYRTSLSEVHSYFDPAFRWSASGARTPDGQLAAYGLTRMPLSFGDEVELIVSGGVHPDFRGRGLGQHMVRTQLQAAREMVAGSSVSALATMHVDSNRDDLRNLVEEVGFFQTHSYVQMRRLLSIETAFDEPPAYISIVPFTRELDEEVRRAHNEIYYEMEGLPPISAEQWAAERDFLDRDWSFVAIDRRGDRPRLAGYVLCAKFEQDWAASGWSEGYIDEIAVHHEWREMNLMSTLLGYAMSAIRDSGVEYAGIDVTVDPREENPRARVDLFEEFNFEPTIETYVMAMRLDSE